MIVSSPEGRSRIDSPLPKPIRQPRLPISLGVPPDLPPGRGLDVMAKVVRQFQQQAFQPLGGGEGAAADGQWCVVEFV